MPDSVYVLEVATAAAEGVVNPFTHILVDVQSGFRADTAECQRAYGDKCFQAFEETDGCRSGVK